MICLFKGTPWYGILAKDSKIAAGDRANGKEQADPEKSMKSIRVVAVLAVVLVASACGKTPPVASMTRHVLSHDGIEREYFVFLPSSYDDMTDHPVAIFLHGYAGSATGTEAEVTQGLNAYAERAGYVVVYPQSTWFMAGAGTPDQWEVSSWNHISDGFDRGPAGPICTQNAVRYPCPPECGDCGQCGWASCHDDVGFLRALVAEVESTLDIDSVFVAGFSNGAMMAQRVACEASDLFDAVALIGGRAEPGFECTPTHPLPLLQVNGGQDTTVPPDGSASSSGYFFANTGSVAEHWSDGEACAAGPSDWSTALTHGTSAECTIRCADEPFASVDCVWPDGDHRWPGTAGTIGSNGYCVSELQSASLPDQTICIVPPPTEDIWGSTLMFGFFDRWRSAP